MRREFTNKLLSDFFHHVYEMRGIKRIEEDTDLTVGNIIRKVHAPSPRLQNEKYFVCGEIRYSKDFGNNRAFCFRMLHHNRYWVVTCFLGGSAYGRLWEINHSEDVDIYNNFGKEPV